MQSRADRLKTAARPLKPTRYPFYVQHANDETPGQGWWWQPAGCPIPILLGSSYERSLISLDRLQQALKRKPKPEESPA